MAYIMNNKGPEIAPSVSYDNCLYEGYLAHGLDVDNLTAHIDMLLQGDYVEDIVQN
jgi:hypothetical protein